MKNEGVVRGQVRPCMKASPRVSPPCSIASTSVYVEAQKGETRIEEIDRSSYSTTSCCCFHIFLAIHRVSICISVISTARVAFAILYF